MGNELFLLILSLSIAGTLIAALVFAIKAAARNRFSKSWQYYIWFLVIIRLLLPVTVETNLMNMLFERGAAGDRLPGTDIFGGAEEDTGISAEDNTAEGQQEEQYPGVDTGLTEGQVGDSGDGSRPGIEDTAGDGSRPGIQDTAGDGLESGDYRFIPGVDRMGGWAEADKEQRVRRPYGQGYDRPDSAAEWFLENVWLIWLFGVIMALMLKIMDYRGFMRYLKANNIEVTDETVLSVMDDVMTDLKIHKDIRLYQNKLAVSPMLVGGLHPTIVIPEDKISTERMPYVLAHELIHYKRHDIWYKWLLQAAMCIHWFNPFLILVSRDLNRGCELSCDEAVVKYLGEEGRIPYGNVLLDVADIGVSYRNSVLSITLVENKKDMKERLKSIMNYKKISKLAAFCSVLVLCFLLLSAVTVGARTIGGRGRAVSTGKGGITQYGSGISSFGLGGIKENLLTAKEGSGYNWIQDSLDSLGDLDVWGDLYDQDYNWGDWKWDIDGWGYNDVSKKENDKKSNGMYDDDSLIRGNDYSNQFSCYNYYNNFGERRMSVKKFEFNGSHTLFIAHVKKDVVMEMKYKGEILDGKFKLVLITPDNKVSKIQEGNADHTLKIALKKGRNVVKMIGKEAYVKNLELKYGTVDNTVLAGWFGSEEEEYAAQYLAKLKSGTPIDIKELVKAAPFLEEKDVSELLISIFQKKVDVTDSQLQNLIPFVDEDTFSAFLLGYCKSGNKLTGKQLSIMAPFLTEECVSELLMNAINNKTGLTKSQISSLFPFADEVSLGKYYLGQAKKGGTLDMDGLADAAPFIDEEIVSELLIYLLEKGTSMSDNDLQRLVPFADEDILSVYLQENMKSVGKISAKRMILLAPFVEEECVGAYLLSTVSNGTKLSGNELSTLICFADDDSINSYVKKLSQNDGLTSSLLQALAYAVDEEVLGDCLYGLISSSPKDVLNHLKSYAYYLSEEDITRCLTKLIQSGTKISLSDLENLEYYMDDEDVDDILDLMLDKKWITKKEIRDYFRYYD